MSERSVRLRAIIQKTTTPTALILIRLMVGGIFLSEGIQKFLRPADLGSGRFEKTGISGPSVALAIAIAAWKLTSIT